MYHYFLMFSILFSLLIKTIPKNEFIEYDGIFHKYYNNTTMIASASSVWLNSPSDAINPNSYLEFCTKYLDREQWFSVVLADKQLLMSSYAIQLGCCNFYDTCCCNLYSWILEGSNDNRTWYIIDKKERVNDFTKCENKEFKIPSNTQKFSHFRFTQKEPQPGCKSCIGLKRMEFFGKLYDFQALIEDEQYLDTEVSIIGHLKK